MKTETLNKPFVLLFVAISCTLFLFASGHTYSIDEITVVKLSDRILVNREISSPEPDADIMYKGTNGRYYSKYGLIHPVLLLPFTAAGEIAAKASGISDKYYLLQFFSCFLNSLTTAATCVVIAMMCIALGLKRRSAFATAVIYAFCTMAFPYSKFTFTEPIAGLVITFSIYNVLIYSKYTNPRNLLFAGLLLSLIPLLKISSAIAIPLILLLALHATAKNKHLTHFAAAFVPACAGIVALLLFNLTVFGSVTKTGYDGELDASFVTPIIEGIYGMLLSGGKGLFFYSPPLILAIFGFFRFARRWPAGAALSAILLISYVVFFSRWLSWGGAHAWGPRHVVPVLPMLAVCAAFFIDTVSRKAPVRLAAVIGLAVAGLAVQAIPVSYKFFVEYTNADFESNRISYNRAHGKLFTPGIPRFVPQAATAKRAIEMYKRWPSHLGNIFKGGGSFKDLKDSAFLNSKAIEESPDFWHSLLLYWKIPILTAATLMVLIALAAGAFISARAAYRLLGDG